ncbi:hypothetical protein QYP00_02480 [Pseudomonas aeruginosa]|nr:hypothetical protein [Pseudomonas aeruginosa]
MDDLGFDFSNAVPWFPHEQEQPYVLVRMTAQQVALLEKAMAEPLRRCYITDEVLQAAADRHGLTLSDVLAGKLPDAGATMAGDFGEVLGYFYQSAMEYPGNAIGPKKWRLKQDRTRYRAVAVICESFVTAELSNAPTTASDDYTLVVISVPNLHTTYNAVFEAARASVR